MYLLIVLFNGYVEKGLEEFREFLKQRGGVTIQAEKIDMLRFVDDIAILTESEEELMAALEEMEEASDPDAA